MVSTIWVLVACHQQHQPQGRTSTLFGNGHKWWSTKEYMVEWDKACCTYICQQPRARDQESILLKAHWSIDIVSFIPSQINQARHPRHATYPGELCLLLIWIYWTLDFDAFFCLSELQFIVSPLNMNIPKIHPVMTSGWAFKTAEYSFR